MLTRQQHRFGLGELAKELHKISQDVKKNKKLLDIKLQVWKDYFWDDIFFYYLFNYDKISNFEYDKCHKDDDIMYVDENVSENIWIIVLRTCADILYDIRHYKPSTCINALHHMFVKTFEVYLRQYDIKNLFITIEEEIC